MDIPGEYEKVFARLDGLRRTADGWEALCPAHDDHNPSLTISLSNDRSRLLLWCRSGCHARLVCEELGIAMSDLFSGDKTQAPEYRVTATYKYESPDGALLYEVQRKEAVVDGKSKKTFVQRRPDGDGWNYSTKGVPRVPYKLPALKSCEKAPVIVVEGEKDADKLWSYGLVATCNDGGAGKWTWKHAKWLSGRRVAVIPDCDEPGFQHAANVIGTLVAAGVESVRLVLWKDKPKGFDVSDFFSAGGTKDELLALIRNAEEWRPHATSQ